MNWLIDRLLILGVFFLLIGAQIALTAADYAHIGESTGFAALVASLFTVWLSR